MGRLSRSRAAGAEVLLPHFAEGAPVEASLERAAGRMHTDDARRLWALVMGVLRQRSLLAAHLQPYLRVPFAELDPPVQVALALGAYEIFWMDSVPDRAAVDQAVEVVRHLEHGWTSGLVNGALRSLLRGRGEAPLPQREARPLRWAEVVASHPRWIVREMARRVGEDEAASWAEANNDEPPLVLSVRDEAAAERLRAEGLASREPSRLPHSVRLIGRPPGGPTALPGWDEGQLWVQDEAAQAVGALLGLEPGMTVLDACAAPGGKTLAAARDVGEAGRVIAVDRSWDRLGLLRDSLERVDMPQVAMQRRDLIDEPWGTREGDESVDAVLLDAPCSGLGVIRHHPEVRWLRRRNDVAQRAREQVALLASVAPAVRPGGVLVYSVCTFTETETSAVVEAFLNGSGGDFRRDDAASVLPASAHELVTDGALVTMPHRHDTDAFYAVRLVREGEAR